MACHGNGPTQAKYCKSVIFLSVFFVILIFFFDIFNPIPWSKFNFLFSILPWPGPDRTGDSPQSSLSAVHT